MYKRCARNDCITLCIKFTFREGVRESPLFLPITFRDFLFCVPDRLYLDEKVERNKWERRERPGTISGWLGQAEQGWARQNKEAPEVLLMRQCV